MSEFYFFYPSRALSSSLARRAFISGHGRVAVETETRVETLSPTRNLLVIRSDSETSGYLNVPLVGPNDVFFYASTELQQSSKRFVPLFLELARGQLSRLCRKRTDWGAYGLIAPRSIQAGIRRGIAQFATLVTTNFDAPGYDAQCLALFNALRKLSARFNEIFLDKALTARRNLAIPWPTKFGFAASIDGSWTREFDDAFEPKKKRGRPKTSPFFQTHNPIFSWADIERDDGTYDWSLLDADYARAEARGLGITLGPLIRWGEALPARYAKAYSETIVDAFKKYVDAFIAFDQGRARRWIVATNVERDVYHPPLETRLALAAQTAARIAARNTRAQVFLGFEQAFGDAARFGRRLYMAPFEMASRIARRRVFDGYYVEVNFGTSRSSTPPRDPMEIHRFFDRWCGLGTPICVGTSCPSAPPALFTSREEPTQFAWLNRPGDSGKFERESRELSKSWFRKRPKKELSDEDLLTDDDWEDPEITRFFDENLWTEKTQLETTRRFVSSAISRRAVDEIIWTRWRDDRPYEFSADDRSSEAREYDFRPTLTLAPIPAPPTSVVPQYVAECDAPCELDVDPYKDDSFELVEDQMERTIPFDVDGFVPPVGKINPTSGLFDFDGKMKPTLHKLAAMRRAFLG